MDETTNPKTGSGPSKPARMQKACKLEFGKKHIYINDIYIICKNVRVFFLYLNIS